MSAIRKINVPGVGRLLPRPRTAAASGCARMHLATAATTALTLTVDLVNSTGSGTVYAYVTGLAMPGSGLDTVHATTLDHRGYASPYDDVTPTGGADQSGAVSSGSPSLLTVTFGSVH